MKATSILQNKTKASDTYLSILCTGSCKLGAETHIETAAFTEESVLKVMDAMCWDSTLLSDHHKPGGQTDP